MALSQEGRPSTPIFCSLVETDSWNAATFAGAAGIYSLMLIQPSQYHYYQFSASQSLGSSFGTSVRSILICEVIHLVTHLRSAWGILLQTHLSQIPAHPVKELFIPTFLSTGVDLVLFKIYFRRKEGRTACDPTGLLHLQYNDKCASGVHPYFLYLLLCGWKLTRRSSGHAHALWFRKDHLMVILH